MNPLLIMSNVPDLSVAKQIAGALIDARAAACVNILATCESVYRWQGGVETATEVPLLIKSTEAAYPRVERILREYHPYAVPEIIAIPITYGLPAYLAWVTTETEA